MNGNAHKANSNDNIVNLVHEITPSRTLGDLFLPANVQAACAELIEEHQRRTLLYSYNLEPRHRVLLAGSPGNGKTSLAEAIASAIMVPMYVVRYEGVVGSYLGETSGRLNKIFDYVRTRNCVLFFDEFETIGKERGDLNETGEIKRVVSSLLLLMDTLPSHVIVVVASNHPELLDRAVWRRFQLRLKLPSPGPREIENWFRKFEDRHQLQLGYSAETLAKHLKGASFAEIEQFGADVLRRYVLSLPQSNLRRIVSSRLQQWRERVSAPPEAE